MTNNLIPNDDTITKDELDIIIQNLLKHKALPSTKIIDIKYTNDYSLINLLDKHPTLINYIPNDILTKYKHIILFNLVKLQKINIYNLSTKETLFKNTPNILGFLATENIIKNSSNPYDLYKINKYLFSKKLIYRTLNEDLFYLASISEKTYTDKLSLPKKLKLYEVNQLKILMKKSTFKTLLNNTLEFHEEYLDSEIVYTYIKLFDITKLLLSNILPNKKYISFLLKGLFNKVYLKLFLKNTTLNLTWQLHMLNKDLKTFYITENKFLNITQILELNKMYTKLDWNSIYIKRIDILTDESILEISNLNKNLTQELFDCFFYHNNNQIDDIKKLSKIKQLSDYIKIEIKNRFANLDTI